MSQTQFSRTNYQGDLLLQQVSVVQTGKWTGLSQTD